MTTVDWAAERRRKRATSLNRAISDEDLLRPLREVTSVMMSIPEADRQAFYLGWERLARRSKAELETTRYPTKQQLGLTIRWAHLLWPRWPPQEEP
jgi:hypothetical protein